MSDITVRRPIKWVSSSMTNAGSVRPGNEDSVYENAGQLIWFVADGMGGHEGGKLASSMVVDSMENIVRENSSAEFINEIEKRLHDVNRRLLEYSEIMLDGRLIGSTFVGFVIIGQVGVCLWMGDSRLYLYRANQLQKITTDHSQVSELVTAGSITEAEAENHPDANVITRAIGTSRDFYVDFDVFNVQLGDVFMLCSDGLYNALNEDDIVEKLSEDSPEIIADSLIQGALTNGANDNVSVVVVKGVRETSVQQVN